MSRIPRPVLTAAGVLCLLLISAVPVSAYTILRASQPPGGAAVEEAPAQVTITFTESPDPALSVVRVLGGSDSFEQGKPRRADGDGLTLVVDLKELPKGSYTVAWRTVSRVGGHASAGAFAFGVGEPPGPAAAPAAATETGSKIPQAAARWVLYLGLTALVGAAWIALFVFKAAPRLVLRLAQAGWAVAAVGLLALAVLQHREAGVELDVFAGSSSGRTLALRAAPLLVAGLALLEARKRYRIGMGVAMVASLALVIAHSAAGHAAVPPNVTPKVAVQSLHFTSIAFWLGGLAALLVGLRDLSPEDRGRAARRFSFVAGIAIVVAAVTGVLRAVKEVAGWEPLFDTTYGKLVIAKAVLLIVLGGFGALNRFRNVPSAAHSPAGLQKAGRLELAIAVVTLAVAGMLSASVPPISGDDAPDDIDRVSLRPSSLSNPASGEPTLELERQDGAPTWQPVPTRRSTAGGERPSPSPPRPPRSTSRWSSPPGPTAWWRTAPRWRAGQRSTRSPTCRAGSSRCTPVPTSPDRGSWTSRCSTPREPRCR